MTSHFLLLDGQKEVEVEEDLRKKRQRHIINVQTSEFQIILQEPATPPLPVRPLAFRHNAGGLSKGGGGRGPDRPGGGAGGCDPSDRFRSGRRGVWSSGVDRHGRPGGRGGAALTGGRKEAGAGAGGGVGLLLADGGGGGGGLSRVSGKEERLAGGIGGGRSSPRPGAGGGGGRPAWPAEGEGMEGGRPNAAGTGGGAGCRPGGFGVEPRRGVPGNEGVPLLCAPLWKGRGALGRGGGGPPGVSGRGGVIRGRGGSTDSLRCKGGRGAEPYAPPKGRGPELRAPGGRTGGLTLLESERDQIIWYKK